MNDRYKRRIFGLALVSTISILVGGYVTGRPGSEVAMRELIALAWFGGGYLAHRVLVLVLEKAEARFGVGLPMLLVFYPLLMCAVICCNCAMAIGAAGQVRRMLWPRG